MNPLSTTAIRNPPPGVESDIYISFTTFIITGLTWKIAQDVCEAFLPKWEQISRSLRDRFCSEMAIIPIRFAIGYVTLPLIWNAFEPAQAWSQTDTEAALVACSLMTGAYLFDLSIHRDDVLSTIHHCMGPALLIWMRTCFSTFSSSDALVTRSLMMFVFFGASTGGTVASGCVFLLRVGKHYINPPTLHHYFSICLAGLTITTVLSTYLNVLYFHNTWPEAYAYFGYASVLPLAWEAFESYLQWRWLFRLFVLESRFWDGSSNVSKQSMDTLPRIFPSYVLPILKGLGFGWVVLMSGLYMRFANELVAGYGLGLQVPSSRFIKLYS